VTPLETLTHATIAACAQRIPEEWRPALRFKYTLRGRSAAGKCTMHLDGAGTLHLNPDYFAVQREDYAQTIAHEYAHAVINKRTRLGDLRGAQVRPHGHQWAAVMRLMGYQAHRCVQASEAVPAKARRTRRYVYECPACCKVYKLTGQRHETQTRMGLYHGYGCGVCRRPFTERRLCYTGQEAME
jgi:predicted SprT family Zn-dependent metalloprotease